MRIVEVAELPDGFDATVDGDGGRRVLHFLNSEPSEKEIEQMYLIVTAPVIVESPYEIEAENGKIV